MKRTRLGQPEWASEEESHLANEWVNSDSQLSITEYIWEHASQKLREEYMRQKEARKNMKFGREVLPDGDIVIFN